MWGHRDKTCQKFRDFFETKGACIFIGFFSLSLLFLWMTTIELAVDHMFIWLIVAAGLTFLAMLAFLSASSLYDPPEIPFFHSIDENGDQILTNGEKTVSVNSEVRIVSDAPLTASEQLDVMERYYTFKLLDVEQSGDDLDDDLWDDDDEDLDDDDNFTKKKGEIRQHLRFLKSLYDDDLIDYEEYDKKVKEILDQF